MKKLIYFLAVLGLWFSLLGCGGGGGTAPIKAGDLVQSFGDGGIVEHGESSKRYRVQDSAIDDEDNIYVVGYLDDGSNKAFIYKFDKDGNLQKEKEIAKNSEIKYFCTAYKNSYIYVGGKVKIGSNDNIVLAKYDKNLNLVTSFGNNGYVVFATGLIAFSLAIDNNEKLYVGAMNSLNSPASKAYLYRFNKNGTQELAYGNSGVIYNISPSMTAKLYPDNNGNIYVAVAKITQYVELQKYKSNGTKDTTFNTFAVPMFIFYDLAQSSGNFYVAGIKSGNYAARVVKIKNTGIIDGTFGVNGEIELDEGQFAYAKALSFDSDDNLYVSYHIRVNSDTFLKLIKYDINGDIDTTFANNGKVEISDFNPINSHIDSDGNLIIVGDKKVGSNQHIIKLAKIHL